MRKNLRIWKPDGVITDKLAYVPSARRHIPTVLLDASGSYGRPGLPRVTHDEYEPAEIVMGEFKRLGLTHLDYLPPLSESQWSDRRKTAFLKLAAEDGIDVAVFPVDSAEVDGPGLHHRLVAWTRDLPRPCGLFAANDVTAELFLALCPLAGRKVPDDIAVIGVDNDVRICNNTYPSLTSVVSNHEDAGRMAAEMRFRAETGHTVLEAIQNERVRLAKTLLTDTQHTLLEITRACGVTVRQGGTVGMGCRARNKKQGPRLTPEPSYPSLGLKRGGYTMP